MASNDIDTSIPDETPAPEPTPKKSSANSTKKVSIDLDIDLNTITHDRSKNPYKNWINLSEAFDSWRIFPRIFLAVYLVLLYQVVTWFMLLSDPTVEQSGLVSIIVSAGAVWFGLYINSRSKTSKE